VSAKKRMAHGHRGDPTRDQRAGGQDAGLDPAGNRRPVELARIDGIPLKFLRFTTVRDRTGLSRSTIWRLERQGAFPKHRRISTNAVGWLEQEINDWVLSKTEVG